MNRKEFEQGIGGTGITAEDRLAPDYDDLVLAGDPRRRASNRVAYAYRIEPHDLVLAKCAAGRERDWEFARESLKAGIVGYDELMSRVVDVPLDESERERVRRMLNGIAERVGLAP